MNIKQIDKQIEELQKEKQKLIFVKEQPGDRSKARSISKHPDDTLHAILANRAGADYLATRNLPHYVGCKHLVEVVFPEFI